MSFQSTPSVACGIEHGGDWGWLVYGVIGFAACIHRGQFGRDDWLAALKDGTSTRFDSSGIVLRECFPTATISVLRANNRDADVARVLSPKADMPAVQAVLSYLQHGVKGIKRPRDPLFDQADALVAALGALPHAADGFRETASWPSGGSRWKADPGAEAVEGTFTCVA